MTLLELPATIEPDEWWVVFHRKASNWWFDLIAFGTFKHVSAFAYCAEARVWVIHDWQYHGMRVAVLPHSEEACRLIRQMFGPDTEWVDKVRRRPGPSCRSGFRVGSCVGAVKHLLGIRSHALRPDSLYRYLMQHEPRRSKVSAAAGRPAVSGAQGAG